MLNIENQLISAEISLMGAELMSLKTADGTQYLWQGDPKYWAGRAPIMFPWTGRLLGGQHRHQGQLYEMGIHGFARKQNFVCTAQSETAVTLTLEANEETKAQYPYDFRLSVTYALEGSSLGITFRVENLGSQTMPFAWGGHPGFNVPLAAGETMADYEVEFAQQCRPDRVVFSQTNVLVDGFKPFPLEEGRKLQLSHDLFDEDAIFLANAAKSVTMRGRKSGRSVTLTYPDMNYLGLWHAPKTDAPYVCIEPWSSLPGREGVVEDFSCRSDLLHAAPGETRQTTWSIEIKK